MSYKNKHKSDGHFPTDPEPFWVSKPPPAALAKPSFPSYQIAPDTSFWPWPTFFLRSLKPGLTLSSAQVQTQISTSGLLPLEIPTYLVLPEREELNHGNHQFLQGPLLLEVYRPMGSAPLCSGLGSVRGPPFCAWANSHIHMMAALGAKDPGFHKVGSKYNHCNDAQGILFADF